MRWSRSKDFNFTYKGMSEFSGPVEDQCPKEVLDLLSPTDNEYALDWRDRCAAYQHARASKPRVRAGDKIQFDHKITFSDDAELDTFFFEKGSVLRSVHGGRYRIPNWRERRFEIIETAPAKPRQATAA